MLYQSFSLLMSYGVQEYRVLYFESVGVQLLLLQLFSWTSWDIIVGFCNYDMQACLINNQGHLSKQCCMDNLPARMLHTMVYVFLQILYCLHTIL